MGAALQRRRLGLVLVASGLVGLFAFQVLLPPPDELEYALQDAQYADDGPRVAALAARGPAVARYDSASDTTVLVFQCAHDYCAQAVRVRGDARGLTGDGTTVLDLPGRARPLRLEPLDPPMVVTAQDGRQHEVSEVVAATVEAKSLALPVVLFSVLVAAVAAGIGLQRSPKAAGKLALVVLTGTAAGLFVAVGGGLFLLIVVPVLAFLLIVGVVVAVTGAPHTRRHLVGVALLLACLALIAAAWAFAPYFTQPPTA